MIGGCIGGNLGGALRGVAENLLATGLREPAYHFGVMTKCLRQAIPGLAGHVGVDFVVREREVRVLEVNPRLTTLYVGTPRSFSVAPMFYVASLFAYPSSAQFNSVAPGMVGAAP